MTKIRISAVNYLNSLPFVYGLQHSELSGEMDLSLDIPSVCAQKLLLGEVDIGLIPVAVIPQLSEHYILGDFCIGARGKVNSVMLYSEVPLEKIKSISLDNQSRTSVTLVRILAAKFWHIRPQWIEAKDNIVEEIRDQHAAVMIGDRTFQLNGQFSYEYDLSEEWTRFTGLPFVFACWVANRKLPGTFIERFNEAIRSGLDNRQLLISDLVNKKQYPVDVKEYLLNNISYDFDDEKRKALQLFLNYISREEF